MVVHRYFASTWWVSWFLTVLMTGIAASSAAFSGWALPLNPGNTLLPHHFDLSTPNRLTLEARMYVERYLVANRPETEVVLGRAEVFFPEIEAVLEEAGLPDALKYVPMVESMLLPEAVSRSGAAGLWQIMPSTARHLGLRVDETADDRFDPVLSGRAAIKLLKALYAEFGDWSLALAAYNCGPGRVRRAIEKADSREYARLRLFLPVQTRAYLSKFVAIAHISGHRQKYGLEPKSDPRFQVVELREIPTSSNLNLQETAVQLDVSTEGYSVLMTSRMVWGSSSAAGKMTISTLRLLAWPCVVSLDTSGEYGPFPAAVSRDELISKSFTSTFATSAARSIVKSQESAKNLFLRGWLS